MMWRRLVTGTRGHCLATEASRSVRSRRRDRSGYPSGT